MLAYGETEDRVGLGEGEAVTVEKGCVNMDEQSKIGDSSKVSLHGDIVRDDGLFLELKLLEDVGLEGLLGDVVVKLEGPEDDGEGNSIGQPLPLDNGRTENDEAGGNIDGVKVLAREIGFVGHCGG